MRLLCGCVALQTLLRRAARSVIQLSTNVATAPWRTWNKFSAPHRLFHIPVRPQSMCLKIHRKTVLAEWNEDVLLAVPVLHSAWLTSTWLFLPPTCNPARECNPEPGEEEAPRSLLAVFQYLKGACKRAGEGPLTRACSDRTRRNGFNSKEGRFRF